MRNKKQMKAFFLLVGMALLAGCNGTGKQVMMAWLNGR